MAEDRRVRKTRTALMEALKHLMKKKVFSTITVSELCEQADVNRSTFYYHYSSTEAVLYELHQMFFEKMVERLNLDSGPTASLNNLPELTDLLKTASNKSTDLYFMLVHDDNKLLQQHICQYFSTILMKDNVEPLERYGIIYHLLASITIVQLWLVEQCPCTAEEMASLVYKMPYNGVYL